MRQFIEVLRLKWGCGLSDRQIAKRCAIARPTVVDYVKRAQSAGFTLPLPEGLDDAALAQRLFPRTVPVLAAVSAIPDWARVHQELKRKRVTLFLLTRRATRRRPKSPSISTFFTIVSGGIQDSVIFRRLLSLKNTGRNDRQHESHGVHY